jgi:hypothetical protein
MSLDQAELQGSVRIQPQVTRPATMSALVDENSGATADDTARLSSENGGEGGIRTHEAVTRLRHFQCRALGQLCDLSVAAVERRGWDSNPRGACTPSCFRDSRTRPLCDPSRHTQVYQIVVSRQ